MDMICVLITLIAALFSVFFKHEVGIAFAGLALALSMQLSGLFQYVVRLACDLGATRDRFRPTVNDLLCFRIATN